MEAEACYGLLLAIKVCEVNNHQEICKSASEEEMQEIWTIQHRRPKSSIEPDLA
jgi:hypothetical protein